MFEIVFIREIRECHLAPNPNDGSYEDYPFIEFVRCEKELRDVCKPHVMCENEQIARKIVQNVNYAVAFYQELRHSKIISVRSQY